MGGLLILIFAWSIGDVSQALQTGPFMASVIGDALPIEVLPVISMILSAVVSFATGAQFVSPLCVIFAVFLIFLPPVQVHLGAQWRSFFRSLCRSRTQWVVGMSSTQWQLSLLFWLALYSATTGA